MVRLISIIFLVTCWISAVVVDAESNEQELSSLQEAAKDVLDGFLLPEDHRRFARQATTKKVTTKRTTKKAGTTRRTTKKGGTTRKTTKRATTKKTTTKKGRTTTLGFKYPEESYAYGGLGSGLAPPLSTGPVFPDNDYISLYDDEESSPYDDTTLGWDYLVTSSPTTQSTVAWYKDRPRYYQFRPRFRQNQYFNPFSFQQRFRNRWYWRG